MAVADDIILNIISCTTNGKFSPGWECDNKNALDSEKIYKLHFIGESGTTYIITVNPSDAMLSKHDGTELLDNPYANATAVANLRAAIASVRTADRQTAISDLDLSFDNLANS